MKKTAVFIFILLFISACSIIGVHFKLHNPKRAGKYPDKTEALELFGNQDSKYRTCYDVVNYHLEVTFGKDLTKDRGITGFVTMKAVALTALDTIQLDAHANMDIRAVTGFSFDPAGSTGGSCCTHVDTLRFTRKDDALFVIFPRHVTKGYQMKVMISYAVVPEEAQRPPWKGGFVRKKDDLDQPWWGVACQSEGAGLWWPCKDVVNDEPTSCDITLIVPKDYMAISNGQLVGTNTVNFEGMTAYDWHVSYPINLYNVTFYIGKFKLLHDQYVSKVSGKTLELNHYVLTQHYDQAKEHFKQLKDHLAAYEELFGPYPFYEDGFKLVESPYSGMEHQTAIAYGNGYKNNSLGFDYIILHETAHEWWGNSLTALDLAEGWLHEGFATYAECLYVEKKFGHQTYLNYLRNYQWTIINRRPVVGPYGMRYFNYKDGDIYTKGVWILHTLRETINKDSVFFDIIKTFATRYAYKNVTSEDFISVVNEKTGLDYHWFFDQYLHNRFVPELEYYQDNNRLFYKWNADYTNQDFKLPVVVKVGPSAFDTLFPTRAVQTTECSADSPVEMTSRVLVKFSDDKAVKREFVRGHK